MNNLILSKDYDMIFDNRMIVVGGVGRSGTSVLSKIIGSLEGTIFLMEPMIIRLFPILFKTGIKDSQRMSGLLKAVLFEDYYLQMLHGRSVNFNKEDESFIGNYEDINSVKARWKKYRRRNQVIDDLNKGKYTFVVKLTEPELLFPVFEKIFKNVRFIHIIRNGCDVISSQIKRGWHTDEYYDRRLLKGGVWWAYRFGKDKGVPWFISAKYREAFCAWNQATRIAHIWRTMVRTGMEYGRKNPRYLQIQYENLVSDPHGLTRKCERFLGLRRSEVTVKNIEQIKNYTLTKHQSVAEAIDPEENVLFSKLMKELHYR